MTVAAAMFAFVLVAGACGGGDSTSTERAEGDTSQPTGDESGETSTTSTEGGPSADEISKLIFGSSDPADQEAQEQRWADQERERQELVAACMTAQGFEYTPVEYPSFDSFGGPTDEIAWDSREYAETYGLGYSLTFQEDFSAPIDAGGEEWQDPNQEYVNGLSESAQQAYYTALYGDQSDLENLTEADFERLYEESPELFQPRGCEGEGFTASADPTMELYNQFESELEDLYQRVEADPRIKKLSDEWAACMGEAGYAFTTQQDMYEEMDRRMQPVWETQVWPGDDLDEADFEAMSQEELDAIFNQPPEVDEELLAEVQAYELELAVANFDCGGNSQFEVAEEVYLEYQALFIEENLAALQALVAEETEG